MGRRPEPIERQRVKARGDGRTPGKRAIVQAQRVIVPTSDRPAEPDELGERGTAEWHKVWDAGFWLHPEQDGHWVEQLARAYDDIEIFRATVRREGLVKRGSMGQPVAHPLIGEIRKCEATIRQCLSVLGFSPTDRARLGLAEVKRQTALQELISRGRSQ